MGAAAAVLATIAIAAVVLRPQAGEEYRTAVGQISTVMLDAGTQIRLNTNSRVRVRLSGDVYQVTCCKARSHSSTQMTTAAFR
jgi:ferric-dicitrate binding protein FerR (iron transport regulator)